MMNSMQSAGSLHYSTVGVTESRRFEYWNDVVLRHCIPAASAPLAGVDFDARLTVRGVGLVDMCSLSAPLHRWDRTARYLRRGPDDDLWLGYMQDGYGQLEQGDARRRWQRTVWCSTMPPRHSASVLAGAIIIWCGSPAIC